MAANSTARVTVKLLDQLSAPANIVRNALRGIRGDMASLSGARLGLDKQIASAASRARALQSTLRNIAVTGGVAGYALARTMKPATNFETTMVDIRQKAEMSKEAIAALGNQIKALAPQVNKSAGEVAKGVDFLLGMGLDPKKAMDIMPAIGKTATAYRAEVEDLAKSSYAVMNNMGVKADEMRKTLDVMAKAGNEGGFELKDMAQQFPVLTASANALGITGVKGVAKLAAALQIARDGAADGATAANNLKNTMAKMNSPETVKKFKKAGIDVRAELNKTVKAGGDPLLAIAQLVDKATKGDRSIIGDFFEDMQVQDFLRPFMEQMDRYKKIRDAAEKAEGVVDADFKIRMESFQATVDKVTNAFNTLAISVGESLIPILSAIAEKLAPILTGAAEWVSANSQLAGAALAAAGSLLALAGIVATIRLGAALLSLGGLKSLRGVLDYLAPKGGPKPTVPEVKAPSAPKVAAPATTPRVGPSVPTAASPGTTATVPRAMSPAEISRAAKGVSGLPGGAASVTSFMSRLKGGIFGAAVQYVGETVIDSVMDSLPAPKGPDGYDYKAERSKSTLQRASELAKRITGSGDDATPKAKPIDPGEYERSRRAQDETRRDPEGARGRAMGKVHGSEEFRPSADLAASRQAGADAGSALKDGLMSGMQAAETAFASALNQLIAKTQATLGAANLTISITPKLEGAGAALRGIHSDTGIN